MFRRMGLRGCASLEFRLRARSILGLPRADGRDALVDRNLEPFRWPLPVVEIRHGDPRQTLADGALDGAQIVLLIRCDEGDGVAGQLRARRAADTMDVVV